MNYTKLAMVCALLLLGMALVFAVGTTEEDPVEDFVYETRGPLGEAPIGYEEIQISADDLDTIRGKEYTAAVLMHTSSSWASAVIDGISQAFDELNVQILAITDAEFDANKQRTDVETILARSPDIIITLVIDPVSGAVAFREAIDQGVTLVLISNLPADFVHGQDYAAIVTDDLFQMGKLTADMIADTLGGRGDVALIYHDADYYVTNQRDTAVEAVLRRDYPNINILTKRGIANPADGDVIASAIVTQYPEIDAIYAPWDTIAEGVVAGLRSSAAEDVAVFTMDLGANNALNMVKDGNMRGIVADLPFVLGETLARIGALNALGRETPAFVTVPAIQVNASNIKDAWQESLNTALPAEVAAELR